MKVRSIKTNYVLNFFRAVSGGFITIAIMPYINRTLGPEVIGKVEYIYTVANYFVLFSALGIPMYGIREIARVRENEIERNKTALELLVILAITTMISYIIYFGVLFQLATFENYKPLLLVMSSMILLSNLGAEWYFQGIEDQLYITIRYIIVRVFVVLLIFLGIKSEADYLIYAVAMVLTLCGSSFFNFFYLIKKLNFKFSMFKTLDLKKHYKPILTIFIAAVSINIYLQLDNFLIGALVGDKYVGYYSVSNKLIRFAISFITIVGTVMLPRLSNLYHNDVSQYYNLLRKSLNIILIISLPTTIIFLIFSKEIIGVMAGINFEPSVLTMQILSPLCVIVGLAYFLGYLVLYPQNKEKIYTRAVVYSALFSIIINYFAIRSFFQNGAAAIAVISELLAILIMAVLAKDEIKKLNLINKNLLKITGAAALIFGVCLLIKIEFNLSNVFMLGAALVLPYILFLFGLYLLKESTVTNAVKITLSKMKRH